MENKHESYELEMFQSLPLDVKVRMTQSRIRGWYEEFNGQVYVSRSGGKDSDVLGYLVREMYPDVPHVFVNTGLEHDSVRKRGLEVADAVLIPEMNFVSVITKYGYPIISKEIAHKISDYRSAVANGKESYVKRQFEGTYVSKNGKTNMLDIQKWAFLTEAPFRISHKCCDVMKKRPAKRYEHETGRKPFIGTLADESFLRRTKWIKFGCNAFDQPRPTSQPLSFWTEQDILHFIKNHNIPIASAYGEICYKDDDGMFYDDPMFIDCMDLSTTKADRTGCVFCMFGIAQDTERFLRLKEDDPKKYNFVMNGGEFDEQGMWVPKNGLGYKFVIDWLNEHGNLNIKY